MAKKKKRSVVAEAVKKLEERVQYLTNKLEDVCRIKVQLLNVIVDAGNDPDAKAEFEKLIALVNTIKLEFQFHEDSEYGTGSNCSEDYDEDLPDKLDEEADEVMYSIVDSHTTAFSGDDVIIDDSVKTEEVVDVDAIGVDAVFSADGDLLQLLSLEEEEVAEAQIAAVEETSTIDENNSGAPANPISEPPKKASRYKRPRLTRCNKCPACTRDDCGNCLSCQDMIKFGGCGTKKTCLRRRCMAVEQDAESKALAKYIESSYLTYNRDLIVLSDDEVKPKKTEELTADDNAANDLMDSQNTNQDKILHQGRKKKLKLCKKNEAAAKNSGPTMCERCGKMYQNRASLLRHMAYHTREDSNSNQTYTCSVCNQQFNSRMSLNYHKKVHLKKKKIHQCPECGKYYRKDSLQYHMRTHTGERPFVCEVCSRGFNCNNNLMRHMKTHTGERPWKCPICSKGFIQRKDLQAHTRTHEKDKTPRKLPKTRERRNWESKFECSICHKKFVTQASLRYHEQGHTGDRPFKCTLCPKTFRSRAVFNDHLLCHTVPRPFKCDLCDKSFSARVSVKIHKDSQHFGKIYNCCQCGKVFNTRPNLNRHNRIHAGIKPFKCLTCDRRFSQKQSLEAHMWTHRPDKRYHCEICGQGYNEKRKLISHIKGHNLNAEIQIHIYE